MPVPHARLGPRIHVIGTSGAGKTTVARRLAAARGVPHVELDALHWLPGWVERDRDAFRSLLQAELEAPAWVVDGNYLGRASDILWERATTIVWLDLPRHEVMWQVTRRTFGRWWHDETLWGTNKERLRNALLSREDSILWWAWTTWARRRREYSALFAEPRPQDVIALRSRREVDAWLRELGA